MNQFLTMSDQETLFDDPEEPSRQNSEQPEKSSGKNPRKKGPIAPKKPPAKPKAPDTAGKPNSVTSNVTSNVNDTDKELQNLLDGQPDDPRPDGIIIATDPNGKKKISKLFHTNKGKSCSAEAKRKKKHDDGLRALGFLPIAAWVYPEAKSEAKSLIDKVNSKYKHLYPSKDDLNKNLGDE